MKEEISPIRLRLLAFSTESLPNRDSSWPAASRFPGFYVKFKKLRMSFSPLCFKSEYHRFRAFDLSLASEVYIVDFSSETLRLLPPKSET